MTRGQILEEQCQVTRAANCGLCLAIGDYYCATCMEAVADEPKDWDEIIEGHPERNGGSE